MKIKYLGDECVCNESLTYRDNYRDPRNGVLEKGKIYKVKKMEQFSWNTRYYLNKFKGYFNSVWFEEAGDE